MVESRGPDTCSGQSEGQSKGDWEQALQVLPVQGSATGPEPGL